MQKKNNNNNNNNNNKINKTEQFGLGVRLPERQG